MIHYGLLLLIATVAADATTTVNETAASCPSPFVQVGSHCVHLAQTVSYSWAESRQFCQDLGGDLAVLSDAQFYVDSQQYIRMISSREPTADFWIGATDAQAEGRWLWIDGAPVVMGTPYWANRGCDNDQFPEGASNLNCAWLEGNYHHYLIDAPCGNDARPFCML